jgi:parallel beta-helix repeat protein
MRYPKLSLICSLVLGAIALPSHATSYYFSSVDGDDRYPNSSTVVKNSWYSRVSGPWKSLAKLSSVTLKTGDIIYLACGSVWRETLILNGATTAALSNVAVKSNPASCTNKPSIRGSDELRTMASQWRAATTNSPIKYIGWPNLSEPEQLFVDDKLYTKARFPNKSTKPNNFALVDAATPDSVTISSNDAATVGGNDLTGSTVHLRPRMWLVSTRKVNSYNGGSVVLDKLLNQDVESMSPGDGVVFENQYWMLDAENEWFYDRAAGRLYVLPPVNSVWPNPIRTELTMRDHIVKVENITGFTIENIDLRHAKINALQILNSPEATVNSVDVSYAGVGENTCFTTGAYIGANWPAGTPEEVYYKCSLLKNNAASNKAKIINSTFNSNGRSAISVVANDATISGNTLNDTGMAANFIRNALAAVRVDGGNLTVSGNKIYNSAYNAIEFVFTANPTNDPAIKTKIDGNTIDGFCVRYADCGAIYTFNSNSNGLIAIEGVAPSSISNNIIKKGIGDTQGSDDADPDLLAGIYLDAFSHNVSITNNVIDNVGSGIYLNAAYANKVSGNWVHGARYAALKANDTSGQPANSDVRPEDVPKNMLRNNQIESNVLYAYNRFAAPPTTGGLPTRKIGVAQEWSSPFGMEELFKENLSLIASRQVANKVLNNTVVSAGGKTTQWRLFSESDPSLYFSNEMSLGQWKSLSLSTDTLKQPVGGRLFNTANVSAEAKKWNFDGATLTDWFVQGGGQAGKGTASLVANISFVGTCLGFNLLQDGADLYSGNFDLSSAPNDNLYYLEYLVAGPTGSMAKVNVGYGVSALGVKEKDWSHELGTGVAGQNERRWVEAFFLWSPKDPLSPAGITVKGRTGTTVLLDEVRLHKVTSPITAASFYDPAANSRMFFNEGATSTTIACPWVSCTGVVDHNGAPVAFTNNQFTLNAGEKKMVFLPPAATWARR